MCAETSGHNPVMLAEAVEQLCVRSDGIYIDGTFGRGGHAAAILARLGPNGRLYAFDKDLAAVAWAQEQFGDDARFCILHASFSELAVAVDNWGVRRKVDGVLLDLGVSSPQLDEGERGFSFQHDGPLDMRMDQSRGPSAQQWLATASEREISQTLWEFGEERRARKIARAIVAARDSRPLETTSQLAELIAAVAPSRERKHPATRSFQAIRIAINAELDDLKAGLEGATDVLAAGGRLVVISFHSLEDRIAKRFIRDQSAASVKGSRRLPELAPPNFRLRRVGGAHRSTAAEIAANPRARSAIMRVAERCT